MRHNSLKSVTFKEYFDLITLLVNFSCEFGHIMTRYDFLWASHSEQYSNRLKLDLILILVSCSCELGQIMTRYDFLWAR